jgi:predicted membrane-bound spermidine synthase
MTEADQVIPVPKNNPLVLCLAFILFFASGFAALLYQVVWQRMLTLFSGTDLYSVTITVASFMAGLGCGSLMGGYVAARLTGSSLVRLFAFCELGIAVFAIFSKFFYYDLLYLQLNDLASSPLALTAVLFTSLLWPTFFMGMSLPLLSQALTRDVRTAPGIVGGLYGVNTLGAALGALISGWLLGRMFGFETTLRIGATLNCLCALAAILLASRLSVSVSVPGEIDSESLLPKAEALPNLPDSSERSFSFPTWILVYALSGFIALSLEILWFRVMSIMAKTVSFTFATLLSLYLFGLAAGTFLGICLVNKRINARNAFFGLQAGITLYAGLSIGLLTQFLEASGFLKGLWLYLGMDDTGNFGPALFSVVNHLFGFRQVPDAEQGFAATLFLLYFAIPLFLIGPPTLMMGMSFPFLQRIVQNDSKLVGRRVGWLQAANILGCTLGTVVTSWIFLKFLLSSGTLKTLIILGAGFLLLYVIRQPGRRRLRELSLSCGALFLVFGLLYFTPDAQSLWATLHGALPEKIILGEDGTGLSVLKFDEVKKDRTVVYVDGVAHSYLPYGGGHTILGLLPALVHPLPKEVAVIGLGSGDTAYAIGCRKETEEITCFEIIVPQIASLRILDQRKTYTGLRSLLEDDRLKLELTDGRAALMRKKKKFDVIEADALFPYSAYAGNLYSSEYFTLVKEHLKPGGFAANWTPTPRIARTFVKVFPHILAFEGVPLLIGSNQPIEFDVSLIEARLDSAFTSSHLRQIDMDVQALKWYLRSLQAKRVTPGFDRSRIIDVNTDLFPKDEYLLP